MSVRRNTGINLAGSIVPLIISLVTVPVYLHTIGDARYGVLAIVWLLVGYFGVFDLGLSRATANQIARLQDAPQVERERVFWTALMLNGLFGLVGGIVLFVGAHLAFGGFFRIPAQIGPELLPAMPWMALAVPVATLSGVLTGSLEGRGQFAVVNAIQVAGTILSQLVPLGVAVLIGPNLAWLIPSAVLARVVSSLPLVWAAVRLVPLSHPRLPSKDVIPTLLRYGAWVTVTYIVSPLMDAADRLIIGATLGVRAVTYYSIPYNLANKANILPGALTRTLFPLLSYKNEVEGTRVAGQAVRGLAAILTPFVIVGVIVMRPFLALWVGADTADRSFGIGEVLLLGVWMNSLASVPYAQLQGQSRPQVVAKFHVLELVPFLAILWIGLRVFGLDGAAGAWSLRVTVDAFLLFWAAGYGWPLMRALLFPFSLIVGSCVLAFLSPLPSLAGWAVGAVACALSIIWSISFESPARVQAVGLWRFLQKAVRRQ